MTCPPRTENYRGSPPETGSAMGNPDMLATLEPSQSLTRDRLILRIVEVNPTASVGFLSGFTDEALRGYLDHLVATSQPRGRLAFWVRPGDSPAIVSREPFE